MDEYYKIAAAYFKEFEPRSAFPTLKNYHWYLWLLTLASFLFFGHQVFIENLPTNQKPYWSFFICEILFLVTCGLIGFHRVRHTAHEVTEQSDQTLADRLGVAKRERLEKLFARPSWQFSEAREEIIKLRKLEKAYRSPLDQDLTETFGKLYDSKTKAKLLTFIASAFTFIIGLLSKSEGFDLVKLFKDDGTRTLIIAIGQLIVVVLLASVATYVFFRQLLTILPLIISSVVPWLRSDQVVLDYLIRDLIKYQTMKPAVEKPPTQSDPPALPTQSQEKPNLDNKLLIIALAVQAAFSAWQATKRKPPR